MSDVASPGAPNPADILGSHEIFAGIDQRLLESWSAEVELVELAEGQKLFAQGEPADSLYIVIEGLLEISVSHGLRDSSVVGERGPGSPLGEIALLTGGVRNASASAKQRSFLARVSASAVRGWISECPQLKQRLLQIARDRLRTTQCLRIMKKYFGGIDEETLRFIEPRMDWVHVGQGELLFGKGDADDSLYFLVHGLLHIIDVDGDGIEEVLGPVYRGEVVGEMSLLTGEKRAASIRAVRDSDLVRLTRSSFLEISGAYPPVSLSIARVLAERLKRRGRAPSPQGAATIALVPVGAGVPLREFAQRLHAALCRMEQAILVDGETISREFGGGMLAQAEDNDPRDLELAARLEEMEAESSRILYVADASPTNWTRRSIDRADRILLVALAGEDPSPSEWEAAWLGGRSPVARTDLVLIHQEGGMPPSRTRAWLERRRLNGHQHLHWEAEADFHRLARIVSGRSVGVVLGGGGAKGIAHIGVLRALEEAGIPVDMIGGSSMGSIVAGVRAMGWGHERMTGALRNIFQKQNPFTEFTLPLISLLKSSRIDRLLQSICGDVQIEDLWTRYFCTSSNLHTCKLKVHRDGPLWRAIRTSCSLPGIMVPMLYEGEVHIDGGVLNNLPSDVMRRDAGIVIAVDVDTYSAMTLDLPEFPSPWTLLLDRIRLRKRAARTPNIFGILLSAFRASNRVHVEKAKPEADLCIEPPVQGVGLLDFTQVENLVRLGHDTAVQALASLPEDSPLRQVQGERALADL